MWGISSGEACGRTRVDHCGRAAAEHLRRGDSGGVEMRALLADDHRLMIAAVRTALEREDDIEIVGTTTDAANVLPLVAELRDRKSVV